MIRKIDARLLAGSFALLRMTGVFCRDDGGVIRLIREIGRERRALKCAITKIEELLGRIFTLDYSLDSSPARGGVGMTGRR